MALSGVRQIAVKPTTRAIVVYASLVLLCCVPQLSARTWTDVTGKHKVEEIEKETRNGRTIYEAEWKVDGKEIEMKVAADGTVIGIQEEEDDD